MLLATVKLLWQLVRLVKNENISIEKRTNIRNKMKENLTNLIFFNNLKIEFKLTYTKTTKNGFYLVLCTLIEYKKL